MPPVILIAPDIEDDGGRTVDPRCVRWLENAGARVEIADPASGEPLGCAHGLLLCGGFFDIPPEWYGERARARVDPPRMERSRLELALAREADARGLPVLGLCGGAQLMAVQRGGALVQDIATELAGALDHERGSEGDRPVHPVAVEPGSRLAGVLERTDLEVNSTHHQAVRDPGRGMRVAARAPDGVVEAIEDASRTFWIGVQWHPERLGDSPAGALGAAFVAAASAHADDPALQRERVAQARILQES